MKFYIVTPAYNSISWLKCCIRSVADQVEEGIEVHHHIQDGASSDTTPEWLHSWQQEHAGIQGYTFTYESKRDAGMYDALNQAWEKLPSDADITAHLNCDEQYLPHALKGIAAGFQRAPKADVVLASFFVVDKEGRYICHRRPIHPLKWVSRVSCEIATCSCFHKVETFTRHGIRFDTRYRSIADMVMYRDMVEADLQFYEMPELFVSSFAITGNNLAWTSVTQKDWTLFTSETPLLKSWFNRNIPYRYSGVRRILMELFHKSPRQYDVYTNKSLTRNLFHIEKPSPQWLRNMPK